MTTVVVNELVDQINALLPQTQCTKCGFEGCKPYAQALANNETAINRCPPGGQDGIKQLAQLLNTPELVLDPECGIEAPLYVAVIDEQHCIGCTLCIQACPVDAIVGANKFMHTVVPELCSGCDLCIVPCPVDCIDMVPAKRLWSSTDAQASKLRHEQRNARIIKQEQAEKQRLNQLNPSVATTTANAEETKKAAIALALARARERRQQINK